MKTEIDNIRFLVEKALAEDIGPGDLTSLACLNEENIKAKIVAKSTGRLSGVKPLKLAFELTDPKIEITVHKQDGDSFKPGDIIADFSGSNRGILTAERTALNFLAHLSGIASLTAVFYEKVKNTSVRLLDTRKTTPGFRMLEKEAVVHGGGYNHRIGLYDMVLIKDNHIAAAGSITKAVQQTKAYLKSDAYTTTFNIPAVDIKIEVEVTNEAEVTEAMHCGVDRLLLDNQTPESLAKLVKLARKLEDDNGRPFGTRPIELEASGNVSLDNVAAMAACGVDFISIGALTHSAPVSDFSMRVVEKGKQL